MMHDIEVQLRGLADMTPADRVPVMRLLRESAKELERKVIRDAVSNGELTWQDVGDILGITRQAAHQRFAKEKHDGG